MTLCEPTDELEKKIIGDFRASFPLQNVELHSDFFELGGDSLNAEKLAMLLSATMGREVQISALFDFPTPAEIARHLKESQPAKERKDGRAPIFMVHGNSGFTVPRPSFFEGLAKDQHLELFQLPGLSGAKDIPLTIRGIAEEYVMRLDELFPKGPIHLSAFCNGSLIALEMAHILAEKGRPVEHLVLLDPCPPNSIERIVAGKPARLEDRVGLFFMTGRTTGGASMADVHDPRLLKIRRRLFAFELWIKRCRSQLTGHKAERIGQNIRAVSALEAAFCHSWPDVYLGRTDVICAQDRAGLYAGDSFWRQVVPNIKVHSILESHREVTGANGPLVAAYLQTRFDNPDTSADTSGRIALERSQRK